MTIIVIDIPGPREPQSSASPGQFVLWEGTGGRRVEPVLSITSMFSSSHTNYGTVNFGQAGRQTGDLQTEESAPSSFPGFTGGERV